MQRTSGRHPLRKWDLLVIGEKGIAFWITISSPVNPLCSFSSLNSYRIRIYIFQLLFILLLLLPLQFHYDYIKTKPYFSSSSGCLVVFICNWILQIRASRGPHQMHHRGDSQQFIDSGKVPRRQSRRGFPPPRFPQSHRQGTDLNP